MTDAKQSRWFEQFVAGVRAPMTWANIDGYHGLSAYDRLRGEERTLAEDLLIERLAHNDGRAAYALGQIRCTRAIPALRERLAAGVPGLLRIAAAEALHQLGDDTGRAAVIDVAGRDGRTERALAVNVLGLWSGDDVAKALEAAIGDPDRDVRSVAGGRLIRLHGLQDFNHDYRSRLGLLQNRLTSPLATVRADALAELADIVAGIAAGKSPEQLSLTWLADDDHEPLATFSASLRSREPPWHGRFAVDIAAAQTGYARRWAEDCFWHFLPTDPRAARALAELGVQRAIAPLRELLPTATGEVASAAATALDQLTA